MQTAIIHQQSANPPKQGLNPGFSSLAAGYALYSIISIQGHNEGEKNYSEWISKHTPIQKRAAVMESGDHRGEILKDLWPHES